MAVLDKKALCGFVFLLAAAGSQRVNYPDPVCAVRGSSVTLLCTFTPKAAIDGGELQITRVAWCQNHEICQSTTPTVYDSEERNNKNSPRYRYQGDKEENCTLQITDVQEGARFYFRVEINPKEESFAGRAGVRVTVTEGAPMQIRGSEGVFRRGAAVTLTCTTTCTFHQLELTWLRDGHALTFTGPALHLGSLTAEDSGNYTCGLKDNIATRSKPHSLFVEEEEEEEGGVQVPLVVGVVFGILLALGSLALVLCIIRRKRAADKSQSAKAGLMRGGAEDDVSYGPIQIQSRGQASRPVREDEDPVIYSTVVRRA